jgi:hypothetical protein
MASGAPLAKKGLKGRSATDVTSIASSDFEEVRLEDLDTASEEVDWSPHSEEEMNSKRTSPQKRGIVGKNSTAPVPTRRSLELPREQHGAGTSEIEASQEPADPAGAEGAQARDDGGQTPCLQQFVGPTDLNLLILQCLAHRICARSKTIQDHLRVVCVAGVSKGWCPAGWYSFRK